MATAGRAKTIAALTAVTTALLLSVSPAPAGAAAGARRVQPDGSDWSAYLYGPTHSSYNPSETAITTANASSLVLQGQWKPDSNIYASPTVVGDTVYIGDEAGVFFALDWTTGQVEWHTNLGYQPPLTCPNGLGVTSTATVAPDPVTGRSTVYVAGGNGYLYALDAATGAVDWRSAVGVPSHTRNDYYNWSSPLVSNGEVYMGIASGCDAPLVRGGLKEYDQHTGALQATYYTVPAGQVGGTIWSSPAVAEDGSIVVTTGNGPNGTNYPGTDSITRLNPTTLAVEDSWQVPLSEQTVDGDFGGSATMFTADLDGASTPMVGACDKNGWYYAWKQQDLAAGPVWSYQMGKPHAAHCEAAAIWDGSQLIEGGNVTTIDGQEVAGSVQSLDPATGAVLWATALPGVDFGSPSEDGAGVVAAPVFVAATDQLGVVLLDANTGQILSEIYTGSPDFAQPVFAQDSLWLAAGPNFGLAQYVIPSG